jgi:RNA polymerase sigma-70 factor (ECF subfamily)
MADRSDFEATALPHLDAVYRAAMALAGRAQDAEDLAQTTLLKALERFGSFRAGSNCKAWLYRILRNTWIDRLRHAKVVGPVAPIEDGRVAQPAEPDPTHWSDARDVLENFADEQVIAALRELPDDQRLTLFLTDVEQMPQDQVAEIMDVAVGTVKSRTSRAREALRSRLFEHARQLGLTKQQRWNT